MLRVLVLPDPDCRPASNGKREIHPSISLDIATELGHPIRVIARWDVSVLGARMPEAPIDEDGDPATGKYDIRFH